jgi:nucleoside-diphosphate-sugar epimerase
VNLFQQFLSPGHGIKLSAGRAQRLVRQLETGENHMQRLALVIGATGGVGGATATALMAHGWSVRAMSRDPESARRRHPELGGLEWVRGDALAPADVQGAASGAALIVHGVNPPGYRNWAGLQLPMLESTIAAARASGASIVLPGTLYNYGRDAFPSLGEGSPQHPHTRKGAIRVQMEQRLEGAARDGTAVLIVRAGDFFGARAGNSWFSQGLVKPGRPVRSVMYPGRPEVGHAWAYLPDVGEAIARLVERRAQLGAFEVFHFGGHWLERGIEMAEATLRVAGARGARIRKFPWLALYALAPFVETFREMLEMRYLWTEPVRLDNRKLVAFLGAEPHTPLDEALRATLGGLGCLS